MGRWCSVYPSKLVCPWILQELTVMLCLVNEVFPRKERGVRKIGQMKKSCYDELLRALANLTQSSGENSGNPRGHLLVLPYLAVIVNPQLPKVSGGGAPCPTPASLHQQMLVNQCAQLRPTLTKLTLRLSGHCTP